MKYTAHINIDKIVERINMLLDQSFDLQITTTMTFHFQIHPRFERNYYFKQKQMAFFFISFMNLICLTFKKAGSNFHLSFKKNNILKGLFI